MKSSQHPDCSARRRAGTQSVEEIRFYRANEKPYGAFSNLYKRAIAFEGREYPSAEHAYQAGKARKASVRDWLLSAPTPAHVAMAAHGLYSWDVVPNWAKTKCHRMKQVLIAKFTQHDDLRELLLSTGTATLIEAGRVDNAVNRFWGQVNGRGQNQLGLLLMEVREELRKSQRADRSTEPRSKPRRQPPRRKATDAAA